MTKRDTTRSAQIIEKADKFISPCYSPLPVIIERGEGVWAYDIDGNKYLDCLSAYSAVNQGHCHPKILKAMYESKQNGLHCLHGPFITKWEPIS